MLIHLNIFGVILFQILQLAVTKVAIPTGVENNYRNWVGNNIYTDLYDDESECQLSELPPDPTSMCCGVDVTSSNRIVGGLPTLIKQYPWLARIEYKAGHYSIPEQICGGSLISGLYVLTAAHCVAGPNFALTQYSVNVVLGDYNKFYDGRDCVEESGAIVCTDGEVRIPIVKIIPHENFTYVKDIALYNDIALVKLAHVAPYTDFIRPICLPASDLTTAEHKKLWLSVAGWGVILQINTTKEYFEIPSDVKRHLRVPYVSNDECKQLVGGDNGISITKFHICAGGMAEENVCYGDSGGPLMYTNDSQYELAGVISITYVKPCGKSGVPGVFTNVYKYLEWIRQVMIRESLFL